MTLLRRTPKQKDELMGREEKGGEKRGKRNPGLVKKKNLCRTGHVPQKILGKPMVTGVGGIKPRQEKGEGTVQIGIKKKDLSALDKLHWG